MRNAILVEMTTSEPFGDVPHRKLCWFSSNERAKCAGFVYGTIVTLRELQVENWGVRVRMIRDETSERTGAFWTSDLDSPGTLLLDDVVEQVKRLKFPPSKVRSVA